MDQAYNKDLFLGPNTKELLSIGDLDELEVIHDWQQLGSETFASEFIIRKRRETLHLIAKTCIKTCPTQVVDEWMERRRLLEGNDVKVPGLYLREGPTIVEEFIDYGFKEAYLLANNSLKKSLENEFIETYEKTMAAGFSNIFLHDARSRGKDIVLVDMGEDIGCPQLSADDSRSHELGIVALRNILRNR